MVVHICAAMVCIALTHDKYLTSVDVRDWLINPLGPIKNQLKEAETMY